MAKGFAMLWPLLTQALMVSAQQFSMAPYNYQYPDLTKACLTALNTPISCHALLSLAAERLPNLMALDWGSVCASTCLTSLRSVRATIASSCTSNDQVVVDGVRFPATYRADYLIYAQTLMCRKDATSQTTCSFSFADWLNQGAPDSTKVCSDCVLGSIKFRLDSPFGYHPDTASQFASLTSSCSKTGYAITKPAAYALGTNTPSSGASCVTMYTFKSGDTCDSVAAARNVSSFAVYGPSGIADCANPPIGKSVCLLGTCRKYLVKIGDTCDSIIAASGLAIGAQLFVAWNPNVNSLCSNIAPLVGQYICLSRPEGLSVPPIVNNLGSVTVSGWPWSASTPTQLPAFPGMLAGCRRFQNAMVIPQIQDSFYQANYPPINPNQASINECGYVAEANGARLADFLNWNPILKEITTGCTLFQGFSYCVDHPTKLPAPSPPSNCQKIEAKNLPPGTNTACTCYYKISLLDQDFTPCEFFKAFLGVSESQLTSLNPWIGSGDCSIGLYTGMAAEDVRAVCIGSGGGASSVLGTTTSVSSTTKI